MPLDLCASLILHSFGATLDDGAQNVSIRTFERPEPIIVYGVGCGVPESL